VCEAIRTVARHGIGVLLVTHNIPQALAITERITVLRDGHRVLEESTTTLTALRLVTTMVTDPTGRQATSPARSPLSRPREVVLHGNPLPLARLTPTRAIRAGLCLVAGDRARHAAVLDASAADNITLGNLRRHVRRGLSSTEPRSSWPPPSRASPPATGSMPTRKVHKHPCDGIWAV
jgi:ABC-type sugar transport system ATPase subunit